jgi:hypothetical protein
VVGAVEEEAVLEPAVVTVVATVVATAAVMVLVTVGVMVSPLAIAMAGPASRSAMAVGRRSMHPVASIARGRQLDGYPLRRRDGRIRQVG